MLHQRFPLRKPFLTHRTLIRSFVAVCLHVSGHCVLATKSTAAHAARKLIRFGCMRTTNVPEHVMRFRVTVHTFRTLKLTFDGRMHHFHMLHGHASDCAQPFTTFNARYLNVATIWIVSRFAFQIQSVAMQNVLV